MLTRLHDLAKVVMALYLIDLFPVNILPILIANDRIDELCLLLHWVVRTALSFDIEIECLVVHAGPVIRVHWQRGMVPMAPVHVLHVSFRGLSWDGHFWVSYVCVFLLQIMYKRYGFCFVSKV